MSLIRFSFFCFVSTVLEVYSLEIQMYSELKDSRKLKVSLDPSPFTARPRALIVHRSVALAGDLQGRYPGQVCDPSSQDHGRHPRVRRKDVDGRE